MENFNRMVDDIRNQIDLEIYRRITEQQGKKLVLFGAGDCGHVVYNMLHNREIKVFCFCDNKYSGHTDAATGLMIAAPEHLKERIEDYAVLVCAVEEDVYLSMSRQLEQMGFDRTQIHIMREYYDRLSVEYLEENLQKYKDAYLLMGDDFSRKVYLARMKKVFLMGDIAEVVSTDTESYFDEKIHLTDKEVFLDCGGFDGDTSVKFIERCGGNYENIIIFEPESCKKAAIEKNMKGYRYEFRQAGVWSRNTKLYFDAQGTDGSHVSDTESGCMIEAVSLDETVYDKKPTFIKMDIEGAEQEALKGSRKVIREYKPKLAVCVYHRPDDLYEIPLLVKKLNPEYELCLRQYSNTRFETILYGV